MSREYIDLTGSPAPPLIVESTERERAQSPAPSRKRKRSNKTEKPPPERDQQISELPSNIFFDITPTPTAGTPQSTNTANHENSDVKTNAEKLPLLLPAHVSVFGSEVVEIVADDNAIDEDYIEYLDLDTQKDIPRYFHNQEADRKVRMVCKHCGEEGHPAFQCTMIICLTCGARNEHSTRSCPINKTCYRCGMKGHINSNCPNSRDSYSMVRDKDYDCERCGSNLHTANECPTWWRLYEYVTDKERNETLATRHAKRGLAIGNGTGGEGYIAEQEWCYNCGEPDHLGDDCSNLHHNRPEEPSAFGSYNLGVGPFSNIPRARLGQRSERSNNDRSHGPPDNVGKLGKEKNIAKMKKAQSRPSEEDDDWFSNRVLQPRHHSDRGGRSRSKLKPKLEFGSLKRDGPASHHPSLLERMDKETRNRDSSHHRETKTHNHGPRYHGGYLRY